MPQLKTVTPLSNDHLESLGFSWHTDEDNSPYLTNELVVLNEQEVAAYEKAGNELYDMFIAAAEHVIENNLFFELGIPFNLIELIKSSWENEIHWHLYGRFDLSGGIDGMPIKLLEFNADTPTALFETAIIQWALLKENGYEESHQFNYLFEALVDNFKRLVTLSKPIEEFDALYEDWGFLFTSIRGNSEEENTVRLLMHIAKEAGYRCEFAYIDEIEFDDEEGIFFNNNPYELWFKLLPWEDIATDEPDLALLLTKIIQNQKAIIFNPAYTLLFQSKGILAILWKLFPNHPLLLECSFEPLPHTKQVKKPLFGREGANISIIENNHAILHTEGPYDESRAIYQAFCELPSDTKGEHYQAGLFFAYEACGVGFRRGGAIIDNGSKFLSHIVE